MLYQCALTIPANTPSTAPESAELQLMFGTITYIEIEFPAGCVGLVGAQVYDGPLQIVPWTPAAWLVSDDHNVAVQTLYSLWQPPFTLYLDGYNEDTVNDHTLQLRVTMDEGRPEEYPMMAQFLAALRGQ